MAAKYDPIDHRPEGVGNNDGFTQVKNHKRSRGGGASKAKKDMEAKDNRSKNAFIVLGDSANNDKPKDKAEEEQPTKVTSAPEREETQHMEIVEKKRTKKWN